MLNLNLRGMVVKSLSCLWLSSFRVKEILFSILLMNISQSGLALPIPELFPETIQAQLDFLAPEALKKAVDQLSKMGNINDNSIHIDRSGRIFFIEPAIPISLIPPHVASQRRTISGQNPSGYSEGVPIFHSLPGSSNVIYLDFLGGTIANSAWNDFYGLPTLHALPYNPDGTPGFSAAEQTAMANIWSRVTEDYSPWMIDVTTERPSSFNPTTLHVLITSRTDALGQAMPSSDAGGVAYRDTFGYIDIQYYSPLLVYYDNLAGGREDAVGEVTSHEIGHAFGLSHDGTVSGSPYYSGAGSGERSWGPIMGASYFKNVVKFNNGDYPGANNQEDDVEMISWSLPLKVDLVGNTLATASSIANTGGSFRLTGLIEWYTDIDVYSIDTFGGSVSIFAKPFVSATNTIGNNLDIALQLLDASGTVLMTADPSDTSSATIVMNSLPAGRYYVKVYPVGNPITPYSVYGSMGQYDLFGQYHAMDSTTTTRPTTTHTTTSTTRPTTTHTTTSTTHPTTTHTTTSTTTVTTTPTNGYTQIYSASMATYPLGWTVNLAGAWFYGNPSGADRVPNTPVVPVIGTYFSDTGLYPDNLTDRYTINSKRFSTVGFSSVKLEFDRLLGVQADDVVTIEGCDINGCSTIWQNSGQIIDTSWQRFSIPLPSFLQNNPYVQIKFGIGPTRRTGNNNTVSFGWNIKEFAILGLLPTTVTTTRTPTTSTDLTIYNESMKQAPRGWTVDNVGVWAYGKPTSDADPKTDFVVGTVITGTGLYPEPLTVSHGIYSKEFSTVGFSSVRLEYDRFLGVNADDLATIHVCVNGCSLIWLNNGTLIDRDWRRHRIALPDSALNQTKVKIRFGLGPTRKTGDAFSNSFGWNIKEFSIIGHH